MTESPAEPHYKVRRRRLIAATPGRCAGRSAVLAGVYGIGRLRGNPADAACQPAVETAARLAPLVHGEVAALSVAQTAFPRARSGLQGRRRPRPDADRLARPHRAAQPVGHLVRAVPQGDAGARRAEGKLGGPDFEVVAVNIDTRDPEKPLAFLKDVGISRLAYYSDQSAKVFQDLKIAGKAFGMPTTLLVDRSGCEIGNMAGPAEWASDDGVKLVSAAIADDKARHALTSRFVPMPAATLASGSIFCCAASISFTTAAP